MESDAHASWENLAIALMIATVFIVAFNAYQFRTLSVMSASYTEQHASSAAAPITGSAVTSLQPQASSGPDMIPKGTPAVYGEELGVSYNDVTAATPQKADSTIKKLGALDEKIFLSDKDKQRYITIASEISCEYCCGAQSIINKNGDAACGCAHSYAMRGLAKHLIKNHSSKYTDDEILEELGKWKTLFFPAQLSQKAKILQDNGIELNYVNLASNKYRGIEQEAAADSGTGMVGGC